MPNAFIRLLSVVALHNIFELNYSSNFVLASSCNVQNIYSTVPSKGASHILVAGASEESTAESLPDQCTKPAILDQSGSYILVLADDGNGGNSREIQQCVGESGVSANSLQTDSARRVRVEGNQKSIRIGRNELLASSCLVGRIIKASDHDICSNHLPQILLRLEINKMFVNMPFGSRTLPSCDGRIGTPDFSGNIQHMRVSHSSFPIVELSESSDEAFTPPFPSMDIDSRNYDNIVVISDLHGDYEAGVHSLCIGVNQVLETNKVHCSQFAAEIRTRLDLIARGESVGGAMYPGLRVLVVQMGDIVDRGPNAKDLYLLFDRLEEIIGWRTVSVMGNHEIWQHIAAFQRYEKGEYPPYVSPEDVSMYGNLAKRCAEFADGLTWERILSKYVMFVRVGVPGAAGGTLFAHGGVELPWIKRLLRNADLANLHVDEINLEARKVLIHKSENFDILFSTDKTGAPFWTRSLSYKNEKWANGRQSMKIDYEGGLGWSAKSILSKGALCDRVIDPILAAFKVDRVIVGHTPQEDELVKSKCDGKIILSDVRISRWMHDDEETPNPMAIVMKVKNGVIKSIVAHYNTTGTMKLSLWNRFTNWIFSQSASKPVEPVDVASSPTYRAPPTGVVNSEIILPVYTRV